MDAPSTVIDPLLGLLFLLAAWSALAHAALGALSEVRLRWLLDRAGERLRRWAGPLASHRQAALASLAWTRTLLAGLAVALAAPRWGPWPVLGLVATLAGLEVGARAFWDRRAGVGTLRWAVSVLLPFGWLGAPGRALAALARHLRREGSEREDARIARLALEHAIGRCRQSGSLGDEEAELLRSVLEFKDTVAREVMVPRPRVVAFEAATPLEEVLRRVVETGHSRYPVYRERLEDLVGLLVAKDLFRFVRDGAELEHLTAEALVRRGPFVTDEDVPVGLLLRRMQRERVHLAVVTDPFGTVRGIVTLEDILEELVGEIQDEHDREETAVRALPDGRILVDGDYSLYDLQERLDAPLAPDDESYDSVGGLIAARLGELPRPGDRVQVGAWELTVREADGQRVRRVEMRPLN